MARRKGDIQSTAPSAMPAGSATPGRPWESRNVGSVYGHANPPDRYLFGTLDEAVNYRRPDMKYPAAPDDVYPRFQAIRAEPATDKNLNDPSANTKSYGLGKSNYDGNPNRYVGGGGTNR